MRLNPFGSMSLTDAVVAILGGQMPRTPQEVESFRRSLRAMPRNVRGSRHGESDAVYTRGERKRLARTWANARILEQRANPELPPMKHLSSAQRQRRVAADIASYASSPRRARKKAVAA